MYSEILLAVYQPLVLPVRVKYNSTDCILTFLKADCWNDNVKYYYQRKKSIGGYFPEGTKREDVTMENFNSLLVSGKRDVYIRIETDELERNENICTIDEWMSYKVVYRQEENIFG